MSVQPQEGAAGKEDRPAAQPAATSLSAGAVFLVIALIAAWSLHTDPYLELGKVGNDPGPAFIPWIGTIVIGLGGLAQMIWALVQARKTGGFLSAGEFALSKLWLPVVLVVSLIGFQMAMRPVGFFGASILFALPWVAIIHWRSGGAFTPRYLVQLPIEAVLVAGCIYFVFSYGINVPFP